MNSQRNEVDVLVAGGGLAGLTAGLYAARLGRRCLVMTGHVAGGQLVSIEKIEGMPGFPEGVAGYDLCPMTQDQAMDAGADCASGEVSGIVEQEGGWLVTTSDGEVFARAVIVATGGQLKALDVPGEDRLRDKGVGHCASCDAPMLRGKVVAVVGGGDAALQEALALAVHAALVVILHRGPELKAQAIWRKRVQAQANIEVRCNAVVEEILGEHEVSAIRTRDAATGVRSDMAIDAVFVYIGLAPNTAFLNGQLGLDGQGRIVVDNRLRSTRRGVFAAGSVRAATSGQAVGVASDGALAALAVHEFLRNGEWPA